MFGKSAFGGGGFGQQQQQQQQPANSIFGQQPQQQQQPQQSAFGGFGASGTTGGFGAQTSAPSAFGAPAQQTTSAFGQPAQQTTSAFGQPAATTNAFGAAANTGSAFGQRPSAFGSPAPTGFGSTQPTSAGFGGGAGGAFGANPTTTTSAFGAPAAQPTGGLFGQRPATTGAFGSTATPATNSFGQPQQTSAFGGGAATSGFGQPAGGMASQGTATADFAPTQDRDMTTGVTNLFQTITAMPQYKQQSIEELRLQDYNQNRKTGSAQGTPGTGFGASAGGFGAPAAQTSTPFGQAPSAFGGQQQTNTFGQPQQPATNAFGGGATQTGGLFGQSQQQPAAGATGFGQQPATNAFGSSAFGANQQTGGFGAGANNATKPFSFGSTPTTSGFGTNTGGFGQQQQQPAATGFGQAPQQPQQTTGFSFGQKPAGTAGGFGTGFGAGATAGGFGAAASKPASSFSFGASAAPATSTPAATGFGGFGAPASGAPGGFGQTQPAQTGFGGGAAGGGLFGAKPATGQPGSLFGNTQQQQPSTTPSFGFGASTQQPAGGFGTGAVAGGGLFGAKPAGTGIGTGGGLFGGSQPATGGGFGGFGGGFGSQQQQQQQQPGTGMFSLPATGGLTSFGTGGLQPGQQPLIAAVDKNPYGTNPLFNTSAIQQQQQQQQQQGSNAGQTYPGKTGPLATAVDGGAKKLTSAPHYPISPRVVSKIKLRGFSFNPASKPTTKRTSDLTGVSDLDVINSGAFTPRSAHRKPLFDKVDSNTVSSLVNAPQGNEKSTAIFADNLGFKSPSSGALHSRSVTNDSMTSGQQPEKSQQQQQQHSDSDTTSNNVEVDTDSTANVDVAIKEGYYCSPTFEVLNGMTPDELKKVDGFVVGRRGFGEVHFDEPVDISSLDLKNIMGGVVVLSHKSLTVYPNLIMKPENGQGLNVPATVKLERCFSVDKSTKEPITSPTHPRFNLFLEKLRNRPGTAFVDYEIETGTWKFKVDSF